MREALLQLIASAGEVYGRQNAEMGIACGRLYQPREGVALHPGILIKQQHTVVMMFQGIGHADVVGPSEAQVVAVGYHLHVGIVVAQHRQCVVL